MINIITGVPKPVSIEGTIFEGTFESFTEINDWIQSFSKHRKTRSADVSIWYNETQEFKIVTLEGEMTVNPGDFVVRGLAGEFYPIKPEIYAMKYNVVKVSGFQ